MKTYGIYLTNRTFFQYHEGNGFYFRLFGYGLSIETNSQMVFSERVLKRKPLYRHNMFAIRFLSRKDY